MQILISGYWAKIWDWRANIPEILFFFSASTAEVLSCRFEAELLKNEKSRRVKSSCRVTDSVNKDDPASSCQSQEINSLHADLTPLLQTGGPKHPLSSIIFVIQYLSTYSFPIYLQQHRNYKPLLVVMNIVTVITNNFQLIIFVKA